MLNALRQEGLGGDVEGLGEEYDLQGLNERELVPGEKAEGAEDYEDISDDDLPDEEMATGGPVQPPTQMLAGLQDAANEVEPDNLFGGSSPVGGHEETQSQAKQIALEARYTDDQGVADDTNDVHTRANTAEIEDMTQEEYNMWRQQQYLFGVPGAGPPPETEEEITQRSSGYNSQTTTSTSHHFTIDCSPHVRPNPVSLSLRSNLRNLSALQGSASS